MRNNGRFFRCFIKGASFSRVMIGCGAAVALMTISTAANFDGQSSKEIGCPSSWPASSRARSCVRLQTMMENGATRCAKFLGVGGFAHFASADDHDGAWRQIAENLLRQINGHVADTGRTTGDAGIGADSACTSLIKPLEKSIERHAGRADSLGGGIGVFDLAENFRFAHQHRIETADNLPKVLDAIPVVHLIKMGIDRFDEMVMIAQKLPNGLSSFSRIGGKPVNFHARLQVDTMAASCNCAAP